MIRAIDTSVDAVIGQVKRCEHHDAVAVEATLHVLGQLFVAFNQVGLVTVEQHGCLTVCQTLAQGCLVDNLLDEGTVALVALGIG